MSSVQTGFKESTPWREGEEDEVRNRIRAEALKGAPILVATGNYLTIDFFGAAVNEKGEIAIQLRVEGYLERPNGTWVAKGDTLTLNVPAGKEGTDG